MVLRQGTKEVSVGALSDGVLEVHITGQMLAGAMISLGEAKVVVSRPGKADETAAIRIYAEPMFDPAVSYDTKQDGETPEGIVVKPTGGVWAFTSYPRSGSRAQHFVEFLLSSGQLMSLSLIHI